MKLTNNRLYLDFNATSPLSPAVLEWLSRGDLLYGNPSSIHHSGKRSRRELAETTEYLFDLFGLSEREFQLFFHSGATEGINTLVKGHAQTCFEQQTPLNFFSADTDHSCLVNLRPTLKLYGHQVYPIEVKSSGEIDWSELAKGPLAEESSPRLVSATWVNNETGVALSLDELVALKERTGARVHVDGVQAIGKLEGWKKLRPELDAYTFSAHKFGAMKGVGMSFVRRDFPFAPLLDGGGQQGGLRSGTQNTDGIYSIQLALRGLVEREDPAALKGAHQWFENHLTELLGDAGQMVGTQAPLRARNTVCFILKKARADNVLTALDLAGIDVSTGSACSSGAVRPSRVLMSMGHSEQEAMSSLRLSFSPLTTLQDVQEFATVIDPVLKRFV